MKQMRLIRKSESSSRRLRKHGQEPKTIHETAPATEVQDPGNSDETRARNERYHELYDIAPIGFFNLDRQGRIRELNEEGARLLGFPSAWLLGKSFLVFVARQDTTRFLTVLRQSIGATTRISVDFDLYVENRTMPVQLSIVTTGENHSLVHRLTVLDCTDQRKTEKLLQESQANWYSLVQNAPDVIMTVESRGRIAFVNKPAWGYSVVALIGTNLLDHIPESEHSRVLRSLDQSFRLNRRTVCEINGIAGDYDRWHSLSFGGGRASTVREPSLTTTTTVVIREISEHKRTEQTLRMSGEQLRDFAARLDAVREEERTRVAREIHDELGQALTVLKLDLSWIENKTKKSEIKKKLKDMVSHVDQTIESVRRISSELRPSILDDLGLIPALEWQVAQFRKRTRIRTEMTSEAEGIDLRSEASVAVFRVVQEALTNIMRHAQASRVRVAVGQIAGALTISVTDNGVGMTRNQETDLKSLGIVGMKERLARLGGDLNIFSEPGRGTRIDIIIPTNND